MYLLLFFVEFVLLFLLSKFLTQSLSRLFHKITRSEKLTIYLLFLLFFPGILIHELSHLFMAGFLFVRTGQMVLFPKIMEDGIRLGSVEVEKTDPFRRAIIGVAPVLFGLALIFGILFYIQPLAQKNLGVYIFLLYIIFAIGNTLFSSKKDLEGTVEFIFASLFLLIALLILKREIVQVIFQILQKPEIVNFFKTTDLFLLAPILINLAVFLIAGLLTGKRSWLGN
jgi:hypothetical protein